MKTGDKVKVTYSDLSQKIGRIVGETTKMWKIDFDGDGEDEKRIMKTMDIELVDDPKTPEKEVVSKVIKDPDQEFPEFVKAWGRKQNRSIQIRVAVAILFALGIAAVAILNYLEIIHIGAG